MVKPEADRSPRRGYNLAVCGKIVDASADKAWGDRPRTRDGDELAVAIVVDVWVEFGDQYDVKSSAGLEHGLGGKAVQGHTEGFDGADYRLADPGVALDVKVQLAVWLDVAKRHTFDREDGLQGTDLV